MERLSRYLKVIDPYRELRLYNLLTAGFFIAQAALILALSGSYRLPIITTYLDITDSEVINVAKQLFTVEIYAIVAIYLLASGLTHLYIATLGFDRYREDIDHKINPLRWYKYAFSTSMMLMVVSLVLGIYDLLKLLMIFALNGATVLFWLMMESRNQHYHLTRWRSFVFGCLVGSMPWLIILMHLYLMYAPIGGVPREPLILLITVFTIFLLFPLNMLLYYLKVSLWKNYLFTESVYITLSLSAKSALAWQVYRIFLK